MKMVIVLSFFTFQLAAIPYVAPLELCKNMSAACKPVSWSEIKRVQDSAQILDVDGSGPRLVAGRDSPLVLT